MANTMLSRAEQLHLAAQPAAGLAYMAKKGFLHLDIAARNCLVSGGNVVKVADFGLTRKLDTGAEFWRPSKPIKIPIKWCSIEVLQSQLFSERSDVWSFGVLIWEIMSQGVVPYPGIMNHEMLRRLKSGERLKRPDGGFEPLHRVALDCWAVRPSSFFAVAVVTAAAAAVAAVVGVVGVCVLWPIYLSCSFLTLTGDTVGGPSGRLITRGWIVVPAAGGREAAANL